LSASVSFLHLYPYKIQIKQKLTDADKEKQVTMCEWFCNVLGNDENFLLSQNRPPGRMSSTDFFYSRSGDTNIREKSTHRQALINNWFAGVSMIV
jgi:hypothetical protein